MDWSAGQALHEVIKLGRAKRGAECPRDQGTVGQVVTYYSSAWRRWLDNMHRAGKCVPAFPPLHLPYRK
jgi:hypothetical protein